METPKLDEQIMQLNMYEKNDEISENGKEMLNEFRAIKEQLRIDDVVRSVSVYSNCEDERLDYRKDYVFHHFVSKRKALIEDKESGKIMEVHYSNFRFS